MKKLIFLMFFAFSLTFINSVFAAEGTLSVSWQVLDTFIRPGGETTVILTLTNPSTLSFGRSKIYITPGPYLQTKTSYIELGPLDPGSSQQTSFIIEANSNAISKNSYVTVRVEYYANSVEKETSVNIPIYIRRFPILQISNISYDKTLINPGATLTFSFTLENYGDGGAKDLKISLGSSEIYTVLGEMEKYLKEIKPGESVKVNFKLKISPDVKIGTYSIPVLISYLDETKTQNYTTVKNAGLVVSAESKFIVSLESQDVLLPGSAGSATVKIANAGIQEAKFVILTAFKSDVFQDVSPKISYIGKINSDDYDTQKFELKVSKYALPGSYPLELKVEYQDPFGNSYEEIYNVSVRIYSPSEIPQSRVSPVYMFGLFVVIVIFVYLVYKKLKK